MYLNLMYTCTYIRSEERLLIEPFFSWFIFSLSLEYQFTSLILFSDLIGMTAIHSWFIFSLSLEYQFTSLILFSDLIVGNYSLLEPIQTGYS